jgi:hypothetical protein
MLHQGACMTTKLLKSLGPWDCDQTKGLVLCSTKDPVMSSSSFKCK